MSLQPTKSTPSPRISAHGSVPRRALPTVTVRLQHVRLPGLEPRPRCTHAPHPAPRHPRPLGISTRLGTSEEWDARVCPSRLAFLRILLSRSIPAVPCVRMSFHPFPGWLAVCFLSEHFLGGKRVSVCPDFPGTRCPACLSPGALPRPRASPASLCGSVRQPHPDTRTHRLVFLLQISGLGQLLFLWQPFQPALSCHFRVQYLLL